jgi:hypothetical protein
MLYIIHSFIDMIRSKIIYRILSLSREVEKVFLVFCIQETGCEAWSWSFRTATTMEIRRKTSRKV